MRPFLIIGALALCGCLGHEPDDDTRSAWLLSTLTAQHRQLLLRAPTLVAAKYETMAKDPYDFFRGTLPLWVEDTTRPGGAGLAPTRLASPALTHILLIGDPHPENVGTFLPLEASLDPSRRGSTDRDAIHLDWNDFDAATFGPPIHDLRRLATGLRLLATPALAADAPELDGAVHALSRGYLEALSGEPSPPPGAVLDDLAQRAFEDRLAVETHEGPEYLEPTDAERRFVMEALRTWPNTCLGPCPEPRVKRLVRRLGAGVASLPLLRFYATLKDVDLVIELKEAREAPALPLPAATLPFATRHNAERVVFAQRLLQADPRLDRLLGTAQLDDGTSLRVAERAASMKGLSRTRVAERLGRGLWTPTDLEALARSLGHLLGLAHRRAPLGPDRDETAREALAALAELARTELGDELVTWSRTMAQRVERDHALFVELLETHGPHLERHP